MKLYRLCFTPSGYYSVSNYRVVESLSEILISSPRNVKNLRKIIKFTSLNMVSFYLQGILKN